MHVWKKFYIYHFISHFFYHPTHLPFTMMSAELKSLPDLLCLFKDSRREGNFLLLDLFLEDRLFIEVTGAVGKQVVPSSEACETTGISCGPSSSSLLSSLFREKIPNNVFKNEGFLFFLDFFLGCSNSTGTSGSFAAGSTPVNGPSLSPFESSVKWMEGSLECSLWFLGIVTHFCCFPFLLAFRDPSFRLRLRFT